MEQVNEITCHYRYMYMYVLAQETSINLNTLQN